MSFTFRVVFEGVCGYVPEKPFFKQVNGYWEKQEGIHSLAVLLPDLRRPKRPTIPSGSPLNFPKFREPHFPLLSFKLGDLRKGTTRRVDLVCRDISEQDERGILFLRREQVRFHLAAENEDDFTFAGWSPQPDDFKKLPEWFSRLPDWWGVLPDLANRDHLESLWWLPDLQRILPNNLEAAAHARTDVLPSYRGPFPEGLIGRVECVGGRLRTNDFNRGTNGFPIKWRFAAPEDAHTEGYWNRALSNSIALEFFDVRGDVHIELKRLANEVVVEEIVLAPAPGASRPILEISISNREPDLLFQEEGFSRSTLPDMDFQPLYENLSRAEEMGLNVFDLPIPHPAKDAFFGIFEKPCAGGGLIG